MSQPNPIITIADPVVQLTDLRLFYGAAEALHGISMGVPGKQVTALIGPSCCGKSTLLRCLNRMNDLIDSVRITGSITLDGEEITSPTLDVIELRRRVAELRRLLRPSAQPDDHRVSRFARRRPPV